MSVTLTITNTVTSKLRSIQQKLNNIPKEAFKVFVDGYGSFKGTPVKSGNAKRNTKLVGKQIQANYPYAGVLDKGRHMTTRGMRGSDQAPQGMTKPTVDFIKKRVGQIVKGK
jgi:hypothetical protein